MSCDTSLASRFVYSRDANSIVMQSSGGFPNTGVWIARRTPFTKAFLDDVIRTRLFFNTHPADQAAFQNALNNVLGVPQDYWWVLRVNKASIYTSDL
jgi:hypothetical protein